MGMKYIRWFDTLRMKDIPKVGGKNAALGEMIHALKGKSIEIPYGFALTADAYWYYLEANDLLKEMRRLMKELDVRDIGTVQKVGHAIRELISRAAMPADLEKEIGAAYHHLCHYYKQDRCDVAVRSSATAEDLPTASFAGQQETFLNIRGVKALVDAYKKSMASLFTDRAIIYRLEKGFNQFDVALSTGVQKMVRSDKAVSGVAFSLDTESGFKDMVMIDASWGLGESIVKGIVNPDEFCVFKPTLLKGCDAIVKKRCGTKKTKLIYSGSSTHPIRQVAVAAADQKKLCLSSAEVLHLARMVVTIEDYYSKLHKRWTPMDVEWAKDGNDGKIYIVQARPETVHAQEKGCIYTRYTLEKADAQKEPLVTGVSVGSHIATGRARIIRSAKDMASVQKGDILVTKMTDPDWVPVMKKSAGIITDLGGRTCHAAIVSRELDTPAVVGTSTATKVIKEGEIVTIDCSQGAVGYVYKGAISFKKHEIDCSKIPKAPLDIMVNIADPDNVLAISKLPVQGVGLARIEFIITNSIKIHPMALIASDVIVDKKTKKIIEALTAGFQSKEEYFVNTLAEGIGMIAATFYPRPVIVRLSDFKTNEYRNLIGGSYFEQPEANPMLGFRGASRYIHEQYRQAFCLEAAAIEKVRTTMGLDNIMLMVPFVRTIREAQQVIKALYDCGIQRSSHLKLVMMCEIPSNVLMMDEFAKLFDGFSIGSNDLTQLTLGVDRDSALLAPLFDERDEAVKRMCTMAIDEAHRHKKFIGICGQAPSDYPKFADFLIKAGIDSISLNPDSVLPFLLRYKKKKKR